MLELSKMSHFESRSVCPENFTGEKGKAAMATEGTGADRAADLGQGWKISPSVVVQPGEVFTMADITGPGIIRHIWITDSCPKNRTLILRMYWDVSDTPSVEVPLGDFFACAEYQNYAQVTSLPVCVNPKRAFNCYWDMPFYQNARITIENIYHEKITVYYQIDYHAGEIPEKRGYFHAQFRRENPLKERVSTRFWTMFREMASMWVHISSGASTITVGGARARSSSIWTVTRNSPPSAVPAQRITSAAPGIST